MTTRIDRAVRVAQVRSLVGCGGGNARLTRTRTCGDERVCARQPSRGGHDRVDLANATARVIAIHRDSLDALRALQPPKDYENMAKLWIALVDQSTDELDAMLVALRAGDEPAAMSYAEKTDSLDARSRLIARKYGITPCKVLIA